MFEIDAVSFRSRFRSSSVVPGCSATRVLIRSPSRSASDFRLFARDFGANAWPESCNRFIESTHEELTPSTSAISTLDDPSAANAITRSRYSTGYVFIGRASWQPADPTRIP
jgi:hypothetical protein